MSDRTVRGAIALDQAVRNKPVRHRSGGNRMRRLALAASSAFLVLTVLAACSPATEKHKPKPSATQKTQPTPSHSATPGAVGISFPAVSGDEVLRITTRATAPNGAAIDLAMTVHYPVGYDSPQGKSVLDYLAAIGDSSNITTAPGQLATQGTSLQIIDLVATNASPGIAWPSTSGVLLDLGPNNTGAAFGLPLARAGGSQGSYLLMGIGSGHAITAVQGTDGAVDPANWVGQDTYYGISALVDLPVTLSDCSIILTPKGTTPQSSAWISQWEPGHVYCSTGVVSD
jgi:hypothetical protein